MKKAFVPMLLCLALLAGCGRQAPSAPRTNNGGTQAVNIPDAPDTPEDAAPAPGADPGETPNPHGAPPPAEAGSDVIEIKEKMFIAQTNDIYLNAPDYLGKTIRYEGIFDTFYDDATDTAYCFVIRYGPGCCGYDANAGFEVVWDGEYPKQDDWVEVVGVLEEYEEEGFKYLRLNLSSLTVLDTRGEEYVNQ